MGAVGRRPCSNSQVVTVDVNNIKRYTRKVIKSFADSRTEEFYISGSSKGVPANIRAVAKRKLFQLEHARTLSDLALPPGNRLEVLRGDREGQYSIRINDRYRLCFRFQSGDAYGVEIVDYH